MLGGGSGQQFFPFSVDPFRKGGKIYLTELPPLNACLVPLIVVHVRLADEQLLDYAIPL